MFSKFIPSFQRLFQEVYPLRKDFEKVEPRISRECLHCSYAHKCLNGSLAISPSSPPSGDDTIAVLPGILPRLQDALQDEGVHTIQDLVEKAATLKDKNENSTSFMEYAASLRGLTFQAMAIDAQKSITQAHPDYADIWPLKTKTLQLPFNNKKAVILNIESDPAQRRVFSLGCCVIGSKTTTKVWINPGLSLEDEQSFLRECFLYLQSYLHGYAIVVWGGLQWKNLADALERHSDLEEQFPLLFAHFAEQTSIQDISLLSQHYDMQKACNSIFALPIRYAHTWHAAYRQLIDKSASRHLFFGEYDNLFDFSIWNLWVGAPRDAQDLQRKREEGIPFSKEDKKQEARINLSCIETHDWVYSCSKDILADHKIPAVVGGDHSTPFGLIKALFELHPDAGLLHIDAHADLRVAYQDFVHSHASIMHNVMALEHPPTSLVQVGIRDFCEEEYNRIISDSRIHTFFGPQLQDALFEGSTWAQICQKICAKLPQKVYVSFDIDGLSPLFCPSTGTPVPGGLSFSQARYLLKTLAQSNRNIIGFDLNEVAPSSQGEWDGNVGARILYQLCGAALFAS